MSEQSTPRFALPGKWGRINLRSEASIQRSIRRVLDEVTRRRDDLVEPRAELRRRFQKAAEIAKEGGATDFYVAFQLVPTIPLPAWVAVFTPEIESTDFDSLGLGELTQFLDRGMGSWGDTDATVRPATTGPDGEIHAVRHSWRRVAEVVEGRSSSVSSSSRPTTGSPRATRTAWPCSPSRRPSPSTRRRCSRSSTRSCRPSAGPRRAAPTWAEPTTTATTTGES
ncbi:hypothetical protein [Homoserinibacter gongjuensis]|uniref:Uncharacterized protein n=1 Tax=Homoserinibacter gongjuensis TaxID=1162968 RepID=A0ABQ6JW70_9MICO|nr:hypothetical protein [Homoserinibacter gongjuensis]GMA91741.1 hypothetical protein GCM10025869_22700 [Homoserinibacter gongjuensis]